MALQTFTAGQVLTAAQMTSLQADRYNQTVSTKTDSYTLVAADVGTRVVMNKSTATTITVNTSLFAAGDTLWIHNIGAGICTITAGTATVACSGSLALLQNQGGTLYFTSASSAIFFPSQQPGLTLLNTTSFSAVSSQSVNNVFSSTYDNYYIICDISNFTGTNTDLRFRLRASGTDYSTANHYIGNIEGTFPSTIGFSSTTGDTSGYIGFGGSSTSNTFFATLASPQLARNKQMVVSAFRQFSTFRSNVLTSTFPTTSTYDGFTLIPISGNISGTVSTYGFSK